MINLSRMIELSDIAIVNGVCCKNNPTPTGFSMILYAEIIGTEAGKSEIDIHVYQNDEKISEIERFISYAEDQGCKVNLSVINGTGFNVPTILPMVLPGILYRSSFVIVDNTIIKQKHSNMLGDLIYILNSSKKIITIIDFAACQYADKKSIDASDIMAIRGYDLKYSRIVKPSL